MRKSGYCLKLCFFSRPSSIAFPFRLLPLLIRVQSSLISRVQASRRHVMDGTRKKGVFQRSRSAGWWLSRMSSADRFRLRSHSINILNSWRQRESCKEWRWPWLTVLRKSFLVWRVNVSRLSVRALAYKVDWVDYCYIVVISYCASMIRLSNIWKSHYIFPNGFKKNIVRAVY